MELQNNDNPVPPPPVSRPLPPRPTRPMAPGAKNRGGKVPPPPTRKL